MDYKCELLDMAGTKLCELDDLHDRKLEFWLNKPGAFSATMNPRTNQTKALMIERLKTDIYVYRNNSATAFFSGRVWSKPQKGDAKDCSIDLYVPGWMMLFSKRNNFIDSTYGPAGPATVAWNMLSYAQTRGDASKNNWGIALGTISGSSPGNITEAHKANDSRNFKAVVEELAAQDTYSFDFEIHNKVFNAWYPSRGSDKSSTVLFEYGFNVLSYEEYDDDYANYVAVFGAGEGLSAYKRTANDAASQSTYKMYDYVETIPDSTDNNFLQRRALALLAEKKLLTQVLKILVEPTAYNLQTDYWLGDTIKVRIVDGTLNIYANYRIEGITVDIDDNNFEHVTLSVYAV